MIQLKNKHYTKPRLYNFTQIDILQKFWKTRCCIQGKLSYLWICFLTVINVWQACNGILIYQCYFLTGNFCITERIILSSGSRNKVNTLFFRKIVIITLWATGGMVLILEIVVHVRRNVCSLICLSHLIGSKATTNLICHLLRKYQFSFMRQ